MMQVGGDVKMDHRRRRRRRSPPRGPRRVTRSQSRPGDLSVLPDELLHLVLARLGCLRAAARTSGVSSRWRNLWTGIDEVAIRDLAPVAIHAALARLARSRSSVSTLDIHVPEQRAGLRVSAVDSLLSAAAGLSPGELSVTIPELPYDRDVAVSLPRLDATRSLKLNVPGVIFVSPPGRVFPSLETLSISDCAMDIAAMLPRCPKLRVLSVSKAPESVATIKVHSASLQEFAGSILDQSVVDVAAPALKKLTLSFDMGMDGNLSVVAPMVEEMYLKCWYYSMYVGLFSDTWRVCFLSILAAESKEQRKRTGGDTSALVLPRAQVMSLKILVSTHPSQRNFAQEMEKLPSVLVSVLELKIASLGHVFGPMVLYLLGIYTEVQKLDIVLLESLAHIEDSCFRRRCHCEVPNKNWRDQTLSLVSITEVEIKGLRGEYHEVDFLALLFKCAPMLERVNVELRNGVIPETDWHNLVQDTFQEYPCVDSTIRV
ncbi:hypothetical protein HU200_010223 [Digitaria exilis]|uniref:F-box domain-containing protein n=1 Tax=Digitaria exilis TaxID=1010633 RepID=A0A835FHD4_9POAL|nr:hypothetical protein HU200_010223 [Digitaria exilis]